MFERNFIIAYIFHSNATKIEDACIKKTTIFCWQPGTRETNDNEPWKTEATPIHKVEKAKSAPPRASPTLLFYLIIFFKKKKKKKTMGRLEGKHFSCFFFYFSRRLYVLRFVRIFLQFPAYSIWFLPFFSGNMIFRYTLIWRLVCVVWEMYGYRFKYCNLGMVVGVIIVCVYGEYCVSYMLLRKVSRLGA